MELTVFGATGGTGTHVVRQALEAGHRVTAVVRDPTALTVRHEALEVRVADVTDPRLLEPLLRGRKAAISALGARGNAGAGIVSVATRAIVEAARNCGTRRFLAVSAAPVGPVPPGESPLLRTVVRPLVSRAFRPQYDDLAVMEEIIRSSALDWTILRPPRLLDRPLSRKYRRVIGGNVPRSGSISRADLAHALLSMVDDPTTVRQPVGIAR
ncbi:NAD(P)-dependent oxidoreductase [Streptomyces sp. ST2-7A]|uniref:NAD(P)-dependent oxidoreductase n=1 Tax=Streptomyces sp. ST2-7A TaxID=2907214 RepID=UPI001F3942D8|nr:SDR family oxidoreductase [Streptomyces sp. ST2-7A]MCE7082136.1 SDR family oxidoreductase [Streptomyces sp. ST2-7A]